MVRPSNPKLMQHVLDAVFDLNESKGSTSLAIQDYVQKFFKSKKSSVLRLEVQRALKHAVNASLLKFSNGRYKAQLILKPTRVPAKQGTAENFEELLPDNFFNQEDEKSGFTAKLRDRPSRRTSRARRARKTRRRGMAKTKVGLKNQKSEKQEKRSGGRKSRRSRAEKNISDTNVSDLSDLADLLNSTSSKTSNTTKQNNGHDSDTQSEISTKQQNNPNNTNNNSNNNNGRTTNTPAKPDQNKLKPKKPTGLAMDDSDYETSQHQLNDREMSEENDLNQMEDIVDS